MLVISEISLALVLLIGAALLIRTFLALHHVDPGFDPHNVLTMEMSLTGDRYKKTARRRSAGPEAATASIDPRRRSRRPPAPVSRSMAASAWPSTSSAARSATDPRPAAPAG